MANIPLKTIKFPGLDDTYTVPEVDNTLATAGKAADAKKTGDELNRLKQDLKQELFDTSFNPNIFTGWKQGYYAGSNGAYESNHYNYVCSISPMEFSQGDIVCLPDMIGSGASTIYLNCYDSDMTYIKSINIGVVDSYLLGSDVADIKYLNVSLNIAPSVTPSTAPDFRVFKNNIFYSKKFIENALTANCIYLPKWFNFIYYWGYGTISYITTRIGIVSPMIAKTPIRVSANSGYKYAVFTFSSPTLSVATQVSNTGWITGTHTINKGDIFVINMAKSNDGNILAQEGYDNLTLQSIVEDDTADGFVLDANLIKTYVHTKSVGALSYGQSFCIYNGKYYSINGSKIAEQASDFTVLRDTDLDTGHGNALQLGSGGIAYASGWSDQKIYAVDLSDLSIDSTITLPTTGYTTCAVDDVNGIAYVFQRDSYPDTATNYNFIVYDYVNENIISSKIINRFGAMQAADYYDGKIVICWGLGTSTLPSGMAVYNTSGDILAEYNLSIFASSEPEGVCIDRETKDLYINIGTTLYRISR